MATVTIRPLDELLRAHPRFWPQLPPIFGGPPSDEDRALALELWRALDPASQCWYTRNGTARQFVGLPLTDADIA